MSLEVDYLPVATSGTANVDTQANFLNSGYQQDGFTAGQAQSAQANKLWRQSSMVAACVANFIANLLNINVLDDGDLTSLITNFTNAVKAAANSARTGVVSVAYSATPQFDASLGDAFEIILTGNVTSSTLVNVTPGQSLKFIIKQDATGGRTFVGPVASFPNIDTTASKVNIQNLCVDSGSNVYLDGPLTVN